MNLPWLSQFFPQAQQPVEAPMGAEMPTEGMPDVVPGGGQSIGALMQPPPFLVGPPKSQVEYANRAIGWSTLAEKVRTDPAYQMAALNFGAQLMQPLPPGQTLTGHFGTALAAGADTLVKGQELSRKADLDERRTRAEETLVNEKVQTGALDRTALSQKIAQNEKTFPKLISELDQKIANMVSQGKLQESQAEYYKERARLYPQEVAADLKRAGAAETRANAEGGTMQMFSATAKAMAKAEGITEEEAYSRLGQQYFGRAGKASAGVQTLDALKKEWKTANPKGADETPEAYEQRAAKEGLRLFREQKSKDYFSEKMDFLKNSLDRERDSQEFDRMWVGAGKELPQGGTIQGEPIPTKDGKADASKLKDGVVYHIVTPNYTGPAKWNSKTKKFEVSASKK